MILFLCDGNKQECKDSISCMSDCFYTRDPEHAKNFKKQTYFDGSFTEYVEKEVPQNE